MKTLTKSILAATFCLVATVPVYAGHGHNQGREFSSQRMDRQQQRIENGILSGELTRKEAKILKKQQRRIHRMAREFREDGRLSAREHRILENRLDRASHLIRELKHNDLTRYSGRHERYEACCDRLSEHAVREKDRQKTEGRIKDKNKRDRGDRA